MQIKSKSMRKDEQRATIGCNSCENVQGKKKVNYKRKTIWSTNSVSLNTRRLWTNTHMQRNWTMWKRLARRSGTNTSKSTTHTHTRRRAHWAQMRRFQMKSQETCTVRRLRLWELAPENRNGTIFLAGRDSRLDYKTTDEKKSGTRDDDLSCELREI